MRILIFLCFSLLCCLNTIADVPDNDDLKKAISLSDVTGYCSGDAAFNNLNATASGYKKGIFWNTEGKDVWFKFTATQTDVSVTITGQAAGNTNTLTAPLTAIYSYENNVLTERIGSMTSNNNLTTTYKGGLVIGQIYYIRVSAENEATGTFKMCVNNYNPPQKPGQDCSSASILCSKETFTELSLSGAGANNHEAAGSCLNTESNSAWYTWTAASDGTLTFSITPTSATDDMDWVLYDLGPNGGCANVLPQNAIRCAAGSGVNCIPSYYLTGLNLTATDLKEEMGCTPGQDGWVKYVDMIAGHNYALLIDNFSNGNNGFTLAFGGTGTFAGPKAEIIAQQNNGCSANQSYTFTNTESSNTSFKWSFGEDASPSTANTGGPHTVTYTSPGLKTVVLEATSPRGCNVVGNYTFYAALKPETPIITANKPNFCLKDVLELSVPEVADATYLWSGPENFTASTPAVSIPITSLKQAGDYRVTITVGSCSSDAAIVHIPPIVKNPVAAFRTNPELPGKYSVPVTIQFLNQSKDADRFEWEFGDAQNSTEPNPGHLYSKSGAYTVTLKAYTNNGCQDAVSINNLVLLDAGTLLIPNSFSPNGDGVNDEFNVNMTNLKRFNLTIFNRFGEKIFNSNNTFNSWNGTWHNQPVPVGAYFYQIITTDLFGKESKHSGSITLIR